MNNEYAYNLLKEKFNINNNKITLKIKRKKNNAFYLKGDYLTTSNNYAGNILVSEIKDLVQYHDFNIKITCQKTNKDMTQYFLLRWFSDDLIPILYKKNFTLSQIAMMTHCSYNKIYKFIHKK